MVTKMSKMLNKKEIADQVSLIPSLKEKGLQEIVKGLYQGKNLLGPDGLLTPLIKELLQISLQGEMDVHLSENTLEEGLNRRNGTTSKRMKSPVGEFELEVPRDRNSSFIPEIIKKRQTVINEELDNKILSLYALIHMKI